VADSPAFEKACSELENICNLDRIEARGTIRLALKQVGLSAATVTAEQLDRILERILPEELANRGIQSPAEVCTRLRVAIKDVEDSGAGHSPLGVFERLGGS
jgi:hypothetical protein